MSFRKLLLVTSFLVFTSSAFALPGENEIRKTELGFWFGASSPLPGSATQDILNTTLGLGLFARYAWPSFFYTEVGGMYANYLSSTERGLITIPLYAALVYRLPFDFPVSFFLKFGGGEAYVVARPNNGARWDPLMYYGAEVSFVAGRKVRIGMRLDFNKIYETNLSNPNGSNIPYQSTTIEPRINNPNYYQLKNADFFHFALMVSFFL